MERKLTYISKNLVKDINMIDDLADLLSISMLIKLTYGSSSKHFNSLRDLAKYLGISEAKLIRLRKSGLFGKMFDLDTVHHTLTARNIKANGHRIGLLREGDRVDVIFGDQVVMSNESGCLRSCKDMRRFLERVMIAVLITEQEHTGHSGRGDYPKYAEEANTLSGHTGDERVYATKSYKRFSDMSGMSLTKVKAVIASMVKDGDIARFNNVIKVLKVDDTIPEWIRDKAISEYINSKDPVAGEKYRRVKDGVILIRANSYRMKRCTKTPKFKYKHYHRKPIVPRVDRKRIECYDPDKQDGRHRKVETFRIGVTEEGEIVGVSRQRNATGRGFYKRIHDNKVLARRHAALNMQKELGSDRILSATRAILTFNGYSWMKPQEVIDVLRETAKQVFAHRRTLIRQYKRTGVKRPRISFEEAYVSMVTGRQFVKWRDRIMEVLSVLSYEEVAVIAMLSLWYGFPERISSQRLSTLSTNIEGGAPLLEDIF